MSTPLTATTAVSIDVESELDYSDLQSELDNTNDTQELAKKFKIITFPKNDRGFPSFFIDHSGLVKQFDNWLVHVGKIEKYNAPKSPCILIEPPKSGKTALLFRVGPMKIKEKFPKALICKIDFIADIETGSNNNVDHALKNFVCNIKTIIKNFCKVNRLKLPPRKDQEETYESYLMSVFKHLDDQKRIIFFLWDEVQVWFKALADSSGGGLFDKITFHKQFRYLHFCVSGSAMCLIFKNILDFPSNGDSWISAATMISSNGLVDTKALRDFTFKTFKKQYADIYPSLLEKYALDYSPAMISFFIGKHCGKENTVKKVRETNDAVAFKLQTDFEQDLLIILKRLHEGNAADRDIYDCITKIALGVFKVDEIKKIKDTLGGWYIMFECLIERKGNFLIMKGYYGYLLANSLTTTGLLCKPRHNATFPAPAYFGTIALVHGMIEELQDKEEAEKLSKRCLASEKIVDWKDYAPYRYFYRKNKAYVLKEKNLDKILVREPGENPYLYFFRCIRNVTSHVKSLQSVKEAKSEFRSIYYDWCSELYKVAKKK